LLHVHEANQGTHKQKLQWSSSPSNMITPVLQHKGTGGDDILLSLYKTPRNAFIIKHKGC